MVKFTSLVSNLNLSIMRGLHLTLRIFAFFLFLNNICNGIHSSPIYVHLEIVKEHQLICLDPTFLRPYFYLILWLMYLMLDYFIGFTIARWICASMALEQHTATCQTINF